MSQRETDKRIMERTDILHVMESEHGRRFVWRLISHAGIYRSLEGSTENKLVMEGTRQAGLFLLGIISEADQELVFTMMREAANHSLEEIAKDEHGNVNNTKHRTINTDTSSEHPDAYGDTLTDAGYSESGRTILDDFLAGTSPGIRALF